ncbi:sesquipedalian [Anaeramoeba ignava]|uniref:Sesquipedalian n=1 Tax=Anaeramoeba ignava TaxID=1746090 RepID=A0A9Q0LVS2_ANAIG|nr:sesquipedalian [Anaeramoeba ignava]|eukprot:Anaeramoba_ignava/a8095_20.p1 GENE.a8095_20~~a8095_20.p1  ORF type:complete len:605 (+),score=226.23 a8095_20:32-1846(+)
MDEFEEVVGVWLTPEKKRDQTYLRYHHGSKELHGCAAVFDQNSIPTEIEFFYHNWRIASFGSFQGHLIPKEDPKQRLIRLQGFLKKEGGRHKSVKKRWFELDDFKLTYSKNQNSPSIDEIKLRSVFSLSKQHDKNQINLHTTNRIYVIQPESHSGFQTWYNAIHKINELRKLVDQNLPIAKCFLDQTIQPVDQLMIDKIQKGNLNKKNVHHFKNINGEGLFLHFLKLNSQDLLLELLKLDYNFKVTNELSKINEEQHKQYFKEWDNKELILHFLDVLNSLNFSISFEILEYWYSSLVIKNQNTENQEHDKIETSDNFSQEFISKDIRISKFDEASRLLKEKIKLTEIFHKREKQLDLNETVYLSELTNIMNHLSKHQMILASLQKTFDQNRETIESLEKEINGDDESEQVDEPQDSQNEKIEELENYKKIISNLKDDLNSKTKMIQDYQKQGDSPKFPRSNISKAPQNQLQEIENEINENKKSFNKLKEENKNETNQKSQEMDKLKQELESKEMLIESERKKIVKLKELKDRAIADIAREKSKIKAITVSNQKILEKNQKKKEDLAARLQKLKLEMQTEKNRNKRINEQIEKTKKQIEESSKKV